MSVKRPEGVTNLHIAPHKFGEDGTLTFGTPERLFGVESLSTTNGYAEATAYSDNQMDTNKRKPSYIDITAVLRELATKHEALISGQKFIDGKKVTSSKDSAPSFAVLYEQTNSDSTSTFRILYNVTLQRDGNENTTVADSVTYDTVGITGKAIPLSNGDLDLTMESDSEGVTPQEISNFFKSVMLPPVEEGNSKARLYSQEAIISGKVSVTKLTEKEIEESKEEIKKQKKSK